MNKRFVVIDDDEGVLFVMKTLLELEGHQVVGFSSSSKALEAILCDPPDCVLTDIMMPEMDGVELCRQLRQHGLKDLHIVVVSAKIYQADKDRALAAGANGFISKSRSDPETMIQEIMSVFSETLSLTFWGCRGTVPVPGPDTVRYGGNTACVSLTFPDEHLFVFDAGTGIRQLGAHLMASGKKVNGTLLLSHPHWDHINFLPFFTPLFIPGNQFEVVGSRHDTISLEQLVANQMDGVHFPITPREFGSRISYRELGEGTYSIGPAQVSTMYLCHPGYCLGYRVEFGGRRICYVTDNELFPSDSDSYSATYCKALGDFVREADLLITDTSYFDEEYPKKIGWGHSALSRVLEVATVAEVKELYLFHHVPEHTDKDIDRMLTEARTRLNQSGATTVCKAAIEGETLTL